MGNNWVKHYTDCLGIVHRVRRFLTQWITSLIIRLFNLQIGHITCNNASNNNTTITEFALQYKHKTGSVFDVKGGTFGQDHYAKSCSDLVKISQKAWGTISK